ncbi:unnamed protein product [Hymenolepis diminuta]|uniref:Uncharacterized protein n=1 Tax=Hymenolepis diminuta TaxID=6216 RepID=A0A0R3SLC1_HYMDI|nr:unnamed protein product [Hymenolepis diminuta]
MSRKVDEAQGQGAVTRQVLSDLPRRTCSPPPPPHHPTLEAVITGAVLYAQFCRYSHRKEAPKCHTPREQQQQQGERNLWDVRCQPQPTMMMSHAFALPLSWHVGGRKKCKGSTEARAVAVPNSSSPKNLHFYMRQILCEDEILTGLAELENIKQREKNDAIS